MSDLTQQTVQTPPPPQPTQGQPPPTEATPTPPIASAPAPYVAEPHIPQVSIPHMGTSKVAVPTPNVATAPIGGAPHAGPQPQTQPVASQSAPHPSDGVTQEAIDAAIRQVEQTGRTDGLSPQVLAAACQQIEAQAAQQGIDLSQNQQPGQATQPPGPSNYVEAAVMDKRGTFENFHNQRESLQSAVAEQREAAKRTYSDALSKDGQATSEDAAHQANAEAMQALAAELKAMDPATIALINAMGVLSNTPEVLKGILWMEIIRAMRKLISNETKHQVKACMNGDTTPA